MSLEEAIKVLIQSEMEKVKHQTLLEISWELREIIDDQKKLDAWYQGLLNKLS